MKVMPTQLRCFSTGSSQVMVMVWYMSYPLSGLIFLLHWQDLRRFCYQNHLVYCCRLVLPVSYQSLSA